jgi:hypothetical protein
MRRTLALVSAAVTSMVAIAFLIPLALIARSLRLVTALAHCACSLRRVEHHADAAYRAQVPRPGGRLAELAPQP